MTTNSPAFTSAAPTVVRTDSMMFIVTYALLVGLIGVALVYVGGATLSFPGVPPGTMAATLKAGPSQRPPGEISKTSTRAPR